MELTGTVGVITMLFVSINWLFAKESHILEFLFLILSFALVIYWQAIYFGYNPL